ncbi:MAG: oligosaccharide flippase family protein [Burkholderiales bacterium]
MSFKRNLVANYVSQIYVTLVGIVMVPLYVRYMGTEAYGLVGFFAMLQAWFQLLDMGLTPTTARESARYLGGATTALALRQLLRALEGIFIAIAVVGGAGMVLLTPWIATHWLNVEKLPRAEVYHALVLMAVTIALRWVCGLYRSLINGFEQQVWLGRFNMLFATARFVLVIPFFWLVGAEPSQFFAYQVGVALLEVVLLVSKSYRVLPGVPAGEKLRPEWRSLRGVLRFSLSIAFTSSVWVFVTQSDKLVLSKLLSLSDYACFTLAVLVASGVAIVSGPLSGVLLPRLSRLSAAGDEQALMTLYRNATQGVALIAWPMALMLACFSEQVLWAWTGNAELAARAAPVLGLYALGNGILAVSAFPYYLQFAKGDVKLHLIGNVLFVLLLIPAVIVCTWQWGMTGAGWAWLCANALYFVFWVPLVHQRFARGLHFRWLVRDVLGIVAPASLGALGAISTIRFPVERAPLLMALISVGVGILIVACLGSSVARNGVKAKFSPPTTVRKPIG